jgi:hypothetical protein
MAQDRARVTRSAFLAGIGAARVEKLPLSRFKAREREFGC